MEERRSKNEPMTREECRYSKEICYKQNIQPLMQEVKEIKATLGDLKTELAALPDKLVVKLDERYAAKEDVKNIKDDLKRVVWIVIAAVLAAVMGLVLIKK